MEESQKGTEDDTHGVVLTPGTACTVDKCVCPVTGARLLLGLGHNVQIRMVMKAGPSLMMLSYKL